MTDARGVFVVGTDTGVGKTVVAGGLTFALRRNGVDAVPYKPVESGGRADARFLADAVDASLEEVCPFFLDEPLAPKVAAERAGRELDADAMRPPTGDGFVVAEGVGGLRVPLTPDVSLADLVADASLPALVVARPSLGTLNHTALTVEALRRRDVPVAGVVVNRFPEAPDPAERTNPDEVERVNGVPTRTLPELDRVTPSTAAEAVEEAGVLDLLGVP
ncbi:MAG: dethiobiotin synthase [Halobacteriales archaeon]